MYVPIKFNLNDIMKHLTHLTFFTLPSKKYFAVKKVYFLEL